MNFEFFITKKIIAGDKTGNNNTQPIIQISVLSIALSLAIMLLTLSVVTGFQNEIRSKVIGFGSHIQITHFDLNNSEELQPISKNQSFYPFIDTVEGIRNIQVYAIKAGIIKTKSEVHGVVLKGIDKDFDWSFFKQNIISGNAFSIIDTVKNDSVLISKIISDKLNLKIGDKFRVYFVQEPIRQRAFVVGGIYATGMEQLDGSLILGDIKHIQKLNDWEDDLISGFEVIIDDYNELEKLDEFIYNNIGVELNATKITDRFQEVFAWLKLLDINVLVVFVFAILVASINMISALLILILNRTNTIGILKALGASDWQVRKIFLYHAAYLIGKGLLFGNLLGIGISLFQKTTGLISLPQDSYYLSSVPIELSISYLFFVNIGTFILCVCMLLIPSYIVTKISPVKAIRLD